MFYGGTITIPPFNYQRVPDTPRPFVRVNASAPVPNLVQEIERLKRVIAEKDQQIEQLTYAASKPMEVEQSPNRDYAALEKAYYGLTEGVKELEARNKELEEKCAGIEEEYEKLQVTYNDLVKGYKEQGTENLAIRKDITEKDIRISQLERDVEVLTIQAIRIIPGQWYTEDMKQYNLVTIQTRNTTPQVNILIKIPRGMVLKGVYSDLYKKIAPAGMLFYTDQTKFTMSENNNYFIMFNRWRTIPKANTMSEFNKVYSKYTFGTNENIDYFIKDFFYNLFENSVRQAVFNNLDEILPGRLNSLSN